MKVQRDYHDKTPDLAERLADDIAAALRLGLKELTLTTVQNPTGYRYYFECEQSVALEHPDEIVQRYAGAES